MYPTWVWCPLKSITLDRSTTSIMKLHLLLALSAAASSTDAFSFNHQQLIIAATPHSTSSLNLYKKTKWTPKLGSRVSRTPWSPHQGAGSTTYSPGPPTNTSYGSPSSSGGTIGGTGNNYDDVRAELKAMMDNPSWDDGVSAMLHCFLLLRHILFRFCSYHVCFFSHFHYVLYNMKIINKQKTTTSH